MRQKAVTIRDVARQAGVSISTVSRVINESTSVSPLTRERVLQVIDRLGYTPYKSAQTLKKKKTGVIGVVIPDISNPFFSLMVRGIGKAARAHGYSVLVCDTDNDPENESNYMNVLLREHVEGVILTTTGRGDESVDRLLQRSIPLVAADRRLNRPDVASVLTDGVKDGVRLTRYLIGLGYRRMTFLSGPEHISTARERLHGFQQAMEAQGLPAQIVPSPASKHGYTFESGYQAAQQLLKSGPLPEALIAANDLMALGALRAFEEQGLAIPEDIGIAGFDHIPLAEWIRPRLTTMEIPAYEIGWNAMELLVQLIRQDPRHKRRILIPTRLIKGESTRRVR